MIEKFLEKLFSGQSDANISFLALCNIIVHFGFEERIKGNHHIFTRNDIEEIVNLQQKNGKFKVYQVKQVRNIFFKYKIGITANEAKI